MTDRKLARRAIGHIKANISDIYHFHHVLHTRYVVRKSQHLARKMKCGPDIYKLVVLASYLHDLGYDNGSSGHESRSTIIADRWMQEAGYSRHELGIVKSAIMATKIPQAPQDIVGAILCDADLAHLASPNYRIWADRLTREWVATGQFPDSEKELLAVQISFLESHEYCTAYARSVWSTKREQNLQTLKWAYAQL